jgi:hypothetical protein
MSGKRAAACAGAAATPTQATPRPCAHYLKPCAALMPALMRTAHSTHACGGVRVCRGALLASCLPARLAVDAPDMRHVAGCEASCALELLSSGNALVGQSGWGERGAIGKGCACAFCRSCGAGPPRAHGPHTGAPRRRIASPVYSEMDTNGDGAVTQADDPYAPYYPGRKRPARPPAPCGRARFRWEVRAPGMAGALS